MRGNDESQIEMAVNIDNHGNAWISCESVGVFLRRFADELEKEKVLTGEDVANGLRTIAKGLENAKGKL